MVALGDGQRVMGEQLQSLDAEVEHFGRGKVDGPGAVAVEGVLVGKEGGGDGFPGTTKNGSAI